MSKWLAVAFVFLAPLSAAAQNQGPMIVERVPSGFVFAPDAKVTGRASLIGKDCC